MKFLKVILAAVSLIVVSFKAFPATGTVVVDLDSVGEVTVLKNRLLGVARTSRGSGYGAYILIKPNAKEVLGGIKQIMVMSNAADHFGYKCKKTESAASSYELSCVLVMNEKSMIAIIKVERKFGEDIDMHEQFLEYIVRDVGNQVRLREGRHE